MNPLLSSNQPKMPSSVTELKSMVQSNPQIRALLAMHNGKRDDRHGRHGDPHALIHGRDAQSAMQAVCLIDIGLDRGRLDCH